VLIGPRELAGGEVKENGECVVGGKKERRELAECSAGGALFPGHKGTSVRRHGDKPEGT